VQVTAALVAGHSVTLTLINHDDNYTGDGSLTLFDDVTVLAPIVSPIANPGFESGLTGWTKVGAATTGTPAHSGAASAVVGSNTTPFSGDASVSQTFTLPAGTMRLTFWYRVVCPDTITYDWATATLKDNVTGTTSTLLAKTCTNNGTWVQASASVSGAAGHSVTLTLVAHDDNYPGDATVVYFDDVAIQ
jgi:hypothetical protein